ncbi:hypothetical protein OIE75_20325 [Streptomyces sp. NBC_01723]|uniref:hypothetical protein n=1 Tax=Streptomyces sp. NBC_01723 TaxID=2975921 RepID=UPI002E374ECF|nr:hypothetical protein [Streptomyces sp. NBC_01723]
MESQNIRPGYVTAHQAARLLDSSLGGVRNLVYRGRLTRAGGTERQPWYRLEDVTAILLERRTRSAA